MRLFKKKEVDYYSLTDWDVYFQDQNNGMPYEKQKEKMKAGEYVVGVARVDPNYGRIDYVEQYERDVRECKPWVVEYFRRIGYYMKK